MIFNKKGFIGPIGDDLPSLVPIIVALLIFFTVFSITLSTYDSKNFEIRKSIDLSTIARTIKGDSLILSYSQFEKNCNSAKLKRVNYNYMVAIYSTDNYILPSATGIGTSQVIQDFIESNKSNPSSSFLSDIDTDKAYFCEYNRIGSSQFSSKSARYEIRSYPIAVQVKQTIGGAEYYVIVPSILAVVIWE